MVQRFDEFYKVGRNDNLGDPDYWNKRFKDLDLRIAAREVDGDRITGAVAEITSVALSRLNDTFTPIVNEAIERLSSVGALFSSSSDSAATIDDQPKTFVLDPDTRDGYVVSEFVSIRPAGLSDRGMICRVVAYDRATGLLEVQPELIVGSGTYAAWDVRLAGTPDLDHATRVDNPHETTAAQVGAYTRAEVDNLVGPIASKAPSVSPTFTGVPKAPTAVTATDTDQVATTKFARAVATAIAGSAMQKTGDTMSGDLAFDRPSVANISIRGKIAGKDRWIIQPGNGAAESGANAGSDFAINSYKDDGSFLATVLSINRKNSEASFSAGVRSNSGGIYSTAANGTGYMYFGSTSCYIGWNGSVFTANQWLYGPPGYRYASYHEVLTQVRAVYHNDVPVYHDGGWSEQNPSWITGIRYEPANGLYYIRCRYLQMCINGAWYNIAWAS